MKLNFKVGAVIAGCLSFAALAADRVLLLRTQNVQATHARVTFLADGGCQLSAVGRAVTDAGDVMDGTTPQVDFNGRRCADLKASADMAVQNMLGVGDGGIP